MELKTKFYLVDENGEKFMGVGVLWLLEKVGKMGSLRKAAASMSVSYTKAYNMIRRLEEQLGVEVLERRKGGSSRDGASLTPFAVNFVKIYSDFQKEAKECVKIPYEKFSELLIKQMEEYKNG